VKYSDSALSGIYEISKIVTSPSGLRPMFGSVVSVMHSFLDTRRVTLTLLDKEGAPEIQVSAPAEGTAEGDSLPMAAIDQIVATSMPLVAGNCAGNPLFAGWKHLEPAGTGAVQTFIGVPLRFEAKAVGTLTVERVWQDNMEARIDHDVRFLTMVASLVGQALKLHRVVAEDRERLIFEQHRLAKELSALKAPQTLAPRLSGILGKSAALRDIVAKIGQVAKSNAPVLIRGETGTGKELFSRAIHELSPRKDKPFVAVNCAALPESIIESELFGHEKGAFTDAAATRKGRFELAHGGTIFLDEIGEISPSFQAKLLRILQEGEFERVGGQQTLKADFRLVCATNRNLEALVAADRFRADLYYRISVVPLEVPPLRERPEDIPELAVHFLQKFCEENGRKLLFAPDALEVLSRCNFPGNVRELENCVTRTAAMAPNDLIRRTDFGCDHRHCLSATLWKGQAGSSANSRQIASTAAWTGGDGRAGAPAFPARLGPALPEAGATSPEPARRGRKKGVTQPAKEMVLEALERTGWVQARAARSLGLTARQIGYAMKKHGIILKEF
jgi:Nif-specific regulatory protein